VEKRAVGSLSYGTGNMRRNTAKGGIWYFRPPFLSSLHFTFTFAALTIFFLFLSSFSFVQNFFFFALCTSTLSAGGRGCMDGWTLWLGGRLC